MSEYEAIKCDLYGSVERSDGRTETVPYYMFMRKSDEHHCRIPARLYDRLQAKGLSQRDILEDRADWYKDSTARYRQRYYKQIYDRNMAAKKDNEARGIIGGKR